MAASECTLWVLSGYIMACVSLSARQPVLGNIYDESNLLLGFHICPTYSEGGEVG